MRCPRCHSKNLVKIGHLTYCRDCISFGQVRLSQQPPKTMEIMESPNTYFDLSYDLSVRQKEIAREVVLAIESKKHVMIQAVCGSGKTELVYPCICHALNKKQRVGFACPRKDLAIELYHRLKSQLKNVDIALVYGGHHNDLSCPLVVLTTHQLYRYWNYFDVLIIDEVDAFPFAGNKQLYAMAKASNKGSFVLLSATAFESAPPKGFVKLTLDRRYHNHDLPVPKLVWLPDVLSRIYIVSQIQSFLNHKLPIMVFVPEKRDLKILGKALKKVKLNYLAVHSGTPCITQILEKFRSKEVMILLTTTLLERGVTFENVQVLVYRASHPVFTRSTLIQIAGRVGRKPNYPTGEVVMIGKYISKEMKACRSHLISKNAPYARGNITDSFKTKKK